MTPQQLNSLPIERRFRLFTQWLGNQPEDGKFDYTRVNTCALGQFAKEVFDQGSYYRCWGDADGLGIKVLPSKGEDFTVKIITGYEETVSPLIRGHFGWCYDSLASVAGLPRRKKMNRLISWFASRFLKHKNALAA